MNYNREYNFFLFTGATIIQSPRDYTAAVGSSAVFQCTASAPNIQLHTIEFKIFNDSITTADNNCLNNSTIRICSRVIESQLVSLICEYSIGYRINCRLSVHDLSRSSEVFCRVLHQSTVEAMEVAELILKETPQGHKNSHILFVHVVMIKHVLPMCIKGQTI